MFKNRTELDVLREYINGGVYPREDLCYEFIAYLKWKDGYHCKRCLTEGMLNNDKYELMEGKTSSYIYYTFRCKLCNTYESPTAGTILDGKTLVLFIEFSYWLLYQKELGKRLSNADIKSRMQRDIVDDDEDLSQKLVNLIKRFKEQRNVLMTPFEKEIHEHESDRVNIGDSTIEEYRYLLQQFLAERPTRYSYNTMPYGVICFTVERGNIQKIILVTRQLSPNGDISASVYDDYSDDILNDHLLKTIPEPKMEVCLINWPYRFERQHCAFPNVEFFSYTRNADGNVNGLVDAWHLENCEAQIRSWLTRLEIKDNEKLRLHVEECLFILYYADLDVVKLLELIMSTPNAAVKKLRKRKQ